jgi:GAF domain-containing protein
MTPAPRPEHLDTMERRELREAVLQALADLETVAIERDRLAERVRSLEERAGAAESRAVVAEEIAARVFALAGVAQRVRAGTCRTIPDAGPLETFTAVIDALAAELDVPRDEITHRMIEDLEDRIVLDRDVLVHLRRLADLDRTA